MKTIYLAENSGVELFVTLCQLVALFCQPGVQRLFEQTMLKINNLRVDCVKGKINIYSSWQQTGAELNQQLYTRLQKIPYVPKQLNKHNYYVKSIYIILREGSFFY